MKISLNFNAKSHSSEEVVVVAAYSKKVKKGKSKEETEELVIAGWTSEMKEFFSVLNSSKDFHGSKGTYFTFPLSNGNLVLAVGLGDKSKYDYEGLRRTFASLYKKVAPAHTKVAVELDGFLVKKNAEKSLEAITEGLRLGGYVFDKYKKAPKYKLTEMIFDSKLKKTAEKKAKAAIEKAELVCESVNIARDFVNEPPNVLHSVEYAKRVEKDVKTALKGKGVKVKILGKADLKKEKMGMFLSVNSASAYEPRLVHLTYTPKKVTSKTKHIALVGKGLTFDTGGYSLKPSGAITNMKFDMAGSSTVYAAFRAAVLTGANVKISCYLGMTDNAVNEHATMPDAIVTSRSGKTVEILNTDAEGRLVLGDVMDYACDQKPDVLIDAATLTGACLIALGTEVCGLMGNDDKLKSDLKKSAKAVDEMIWELPIIDEWRNDMKSNIADLKNIGGSRWGGTAKAAAFLENFIKNDVKWAHLDIAGIGDSQSHLSYCPSKGGSGLIVRTLVNYLHNAK